MYVKNDNLQKKNQVHKKQDEDTANLQIPLHLRYLF